MSTETKEKKLSRADACFAAIREVSEPTALADLVARAAELSGGEADGKLERSVAYHLKAAVALGLVATDIVVKPAERAKKGK